jgi:hypothetical protein
VATDFSRWVSDTLADRELGARVARIERELALRRAADVEWARRRMADAVEDRYLDSEPGSG